jgi:hypothetical protein
MPHVDFKRGLQAEKDFAESYLKDFEWATKHQNMFEHWDVKGILSDLSERPLKFDVKALKKINKSDKDTSDDCTWIEGTNVNGDAGWIKGQSDYIVFERNDSWTCIERVALLKWVAQKIRDKGVKTGKGLYELYQREGRKDIITLIKFSDIDSITVLNLSK